MLDAIIRHWLMILVENYVGPEVSYLMVQRMGSFFYADNELIVFMRPEWLQ